MTQRRVFPASARVVIVGGGIMGAATAYELAAAGVDNVVVLERNELGSGSTCKAAGGLRSQFSDEVNILLGARSLETFRRFKEKFDQDLDLVQSGYLFLLDNEADTAAFERNVALQQSLGQNSRMVTVAQAQELSPVISTDGLVAGAFNPDDAHCTPEAAVAGYVRAARRLGVQFFTRTEVTGITVEAGAITGVSAQIADEGGEAPEVRTAEIATDTVICTAGAWSGQVGDMAGVTLPVTPLRRHIVVSEPVGFGVRSLPFTIDFSTSYYFHSEGDGLLVGCPEETDVWEFTEKRDAGWLEYLCGFITRRTPALADIRPRRGWAGLYETTPDHNALIGTSAEVGGFHYACGFSGHGFLQGPAVGEVMRDLYLGREPFVDVAGMGVERFASSELRVELNIV